MEDVTIEVKKREVAGDGACRRLRREGWIPAVVYGGERETIPVQIEKRPLLETFKDGGTENRIFLLKLLGTDKSRHAMIRELQIDPISRQILHIDFQRILMDEKIRVKVHVRVAGTAIGVKNEGGILDFVSRELEVECLPGRIPQEIVADVSALHVGQHLEAGMLTLPEGVVLHDEPHKVVAAIAHSRTEAVAAETAATPAAEGKEPEVIKRGKTGEGEA